MKAIEMINVNKTYPSGFSLKDINLEVERGTIVGFIGENGAGKTTLIKALAGILNIDQGQIKIFGSHIKDGGIDIKEDLGLVLDDMFFPLKLNAKDINTIMQGIYKAWDRDLFYSYLEKFKIPDKLSLNALSKGMKKKLELATALSHRPKLLILDEPTSGLDPVIREEVLDIFLDFIQDEDHTIFLSSHITSDLDKVADEIIFIDQGKILLAANKDEILNSYGLVKCGLEDIEKIDPTYIISKRKTKYFYELLVSDKKALEDKHPDFVVDNISLEDLMVLIIKGEK